MAPDTVGIGNRHLGTANKRRLFDLQARYLVRACSSPCDPPTLSHFSRNGAINACREGRHLKAPVPAHAIACDTALIPGFYFADENDPQARRTPQAPDANVSVVYVGFANTCFGGAWEKDSGFA